MTPPFPDALIVLTGGHGRRLGTVDKAELRLAGETLLDRAIATVQPRPVIVAGNHVRDALQIVSAPEDPPGGGPAAGVAAAVRGLVSLRDNRGFAAPALEAPDTLLAVMAVDQAGVTADTWERLAAAASAARHTGAVLTSGGRRHYGVMVARAPALCDALATRASWHHASLRRLLDPLISAEVDAQAAEADDIDTPEAWRRWQQRDGVDE